MQAELKKCMLITPVLLYVFNVHVYFFATHPPKLACFAYLMFDSKGKSHTTRAEKNPFLGQQVTR